MIMIGIGANLESPDHGPPITTCTLALEALGAMEVTVVRRSRWYRSLPIPASDQPPFINGVIEVATQHDARELLFVLHAVEDKFGRRRGVKNAARVLDLDLLIYNDEISGPGSSVTLPHPRMHERAFVLKPLVELAPDWSHPMFGLDASELLARIPPGQIAEPIEFPSPDGAPL